MGSGATLVIDVPLNITPISGSAGTSITVQSPNFVNSGNTFLCFNEQPSIALYNPTTGTSQYLASACQMPGTVTVPANLVSGQMYEIELIASGYVIGQASFTAQ